MINSTDKSVRVERVGSDDKGNCTVVLNTEDYENKAAEILDNPPFVKLDKDPTYKNEQRVNDTQEIGEEREE